MKVLLPMDGSHHSELAVETLARAGWLKPSKILLVNVVQPVESFLPFQVDSAIISKEQEIVARRSEWLVKPAQYLANKFPECPSVDYRVKFGHPKQVIVNMVARESYDLVVMGSHGRSGVEKLLLGSVSQTVLELAPSAVLLAKTIPSDTKMVATNFNRILVPYDGSVYSRDAVDWLSQQSFPKGTRFHVVMAVPDFERVEKLDLTQEQCEVIKDQWSMIKQRAFEILEEMALQLGEQVGNESVSIDAIPGDPREIIYQELEEFGADCIVLGSHGRTGLDKVMIGSISLNIAQHAPLPVLVVRRMTNVEIPFDEEDIDDEAYSDENIRSGREDRPPFTMF